MCFGITVIIAEIMLRGQRLDIAARDTLESNKNQSTHTLHRLINEWSEIMPAHFDVYPLLDAGTAQKYLNEGSRGRKKR